MARLTDDQVEAAATVLVDLRAGRTVMYGLPPELTPEAAADVQRIIDAVGGAVDRPVRGWKTYCLYKPMNPILYAPIYDVFPSGTEIPAVVSPARLIEPEIMFRVERDLPRRDARYGVAELMDAVTAVVGFEVIGSRFVMGAPADGSTDRGVGSLYGALSDHLANGAVVIGDEIAGWRDVAFEDVRLRVTEDGREVVAVVGCHPFDDPFLPVVVGVNRLRRHQGAKAGDIIVTNSSTSILPSSAGTVITATYEGVGEVTASFAVA